MTDNLVHRADIALADLTANGGILDPEYQGSFFQKVVDQPTLLREARGIPMSGPDYKIPKIGFGTRLLHPARQAGGWQDDGSNTRHLLAAERSAPDFSQVLMSSTEYQAEIHITDEVLEDNIEGESLTNTIMDLVAEHTALNLEELIISADTASGDAYLATRDGVLKQSTSHIVDAAGAGVSVGVFNAMKKSMPTKYRRNLNTMRYYTSMDVESDYRVQVAARGTDLGDATLTGNRPLPVLGVPLRGIALMPESSGLLINPQNIIWGIQRNVRLERERDARGRQWIIVITMRIAMVIEEEDAVVKLTNLGSL